MMCCEVNAMGKFDQVTAALEALPEARREEIAAIMETLFHGDLHPESRLTEQQIDDLSARLANPGPIATDSEVEAFFARFKG
jgi:hypothetical protein